MEQHLRSIRARFDEFDRTHPTVVAMWRDHIDRTISSFNEFERSVDTAIAAIRCTSSDCDLMAVATLYALASTGGIVPAND